MASLRSTGKAQLLISADLGVDAAARVIAAFRRSRFGKEVTDEEIADHDLGLKAGLAGKPNDDTKSKAWHRRWADAQD